MISLKDQITWTLTKLVTELKSSFLNLFLFTHCMHSCTLHNICHTCHLVIFLWDFSYKSIHDQGQVSPPPSDLQTLPLGVLSGSIKGIPMDLKGAMRTHILRALKWASNLIGLNWGLKSTHQKTILSPELIQRQADLINWILVSPDISIGGSSSSSQ